MAHPEFPDSANDAGPAEPKSPFAGRVTALEADNVQLADQVAMLGQALRDRAAFAEVLDRQNSEDRAAFKARIRELTEQLDRMIHDQPAAEPKAGTKADIPEGVEPLDSEALGTKERTSLLIIVAALAKQASISLATPSKSAEVIAAYAAEMGAPVGKRTIEEHLKKIPDALARRST